MGTLRSVGIVAGLNALLLVGAGARAGTLTSATWVQVIESGAAGMVGSIPITRTTAQLSATGASTASSVAVSLSFPALDTTFFMPFPQIDLAFQVTQGGPQAITATPGMGGGTPGVPGTLVVMSAIHIAKGVNQSRFVVGANTVVQVPLSVGKAAQFTGTFFVVGVVHRVTVDFYAWTPGVVTFTGLTSDGNPLPNVTAAGSFNLTANGGGTVTLVSPSKVSIDGSLSQQRRVGITTLALSFVPEPGSLLLLGAGALALGAAHRRRR